MITEISRKPPVGLMAFLLVTGHWYMLMDVTIPALSRSSKCLLVTRRGGENLQGLIGHRLIWTLGEVCLIISDLGLYLHLE